MNPKYHLLVAAAALSMGACSTDDTCPEPEPVPENGGYKISFTVAEDAETRTTLWMLEAGIILRWVPTDKVGIFTVGQNGESVNSNIVTTADVSKSPVEFVGTLEQPVSSGDMFYAYYPYNASQSTDPSAVKLSIPAEQTQSAEGFYNGQSNPLVAVPMEFSQEWGNAGHINSVRFRPLGAIVEMQLYSSNEAYSTESIRSVAFESETPLAGNFSFDLTSVTVKEALPISGYASKVATTLLEKPVAIPAASNGAERVYLTIAPGQYTGQIVVKTDAAKYTFRLKNSMDFKRAAIKGLPADLAKAERELYSEDPIPFADPEVKQICIDNWDTNTDGELSYKEVAAVTSIESQFKGTSISSFNELQYFTGLRSIGGLAFFNCKSLTSINIPEGVTSIGSQAFESCSSLTSINIPEGVTSIGERTFLSCSGLTSITIPDQVTSIGNGAFSACESLTSINIPEGVTSIGNGAFQGCSSLTSITIPDQVTSIGEYAFSACESLTSITIPDQVTSIENYTFEGCSSLESITIPKGVTEIGNEAFVYCIGLTSITIPEGVTTIKQGTFSGCFGLTSITIPEGVTEIGNDAFYYCSSLTSVYCKPTNPPTLGSSVFSNTPSSMKISVPAASVDAYKAAENWSTYASQIVAYNN